MSDGANETVKMGSKTPRVPEGDRVVVEQAIAAAELHTGAEFVVAVAARSGRYDRAEDLFGLVFGLLGVTAAWLLFQGVMPNPGARWSHFTTRGMSPATGIRIR